MCYPPPMLVTASSLSPAHVDLPTPVPVHEKDHDCEYEWSADCERQHAAGIELGVGRHNQMDSPARDGLAGGVLARRSRDGNHVHHEIAVEDGVDPPVNSRGLPRR